MPKPTPMIYLDNNATTIMPPEVVQAMVKWSNRGNPSASYASAGASRAMMMDFRNYIGKLCNVKVCCPESRDIGKSAVRGATPDDYKVIFMSGASEANCTVLRSVVDAYTDAMKQPPHIVMSAIEHKSLIDQAHSYVNRGVATVTFVQPGVSGHIHPDDVAKAIQANTCIVCVMHANNETGAINDIAAIGAISHKHNAVYHCDTVQTFGKFPIDPIRDNVDSFCVSFHKFNGPPGCGALIIKQKLLQGYKLAPGIFGSQNEGLRGGTENLPGIGASYEALKMAMNQRNGKNKTQLAIKTYILKELSQRIPTRSYTQYCAAVNKQAIELIIFSDTTKLYLSNTIFLSVVKRTKPVICNVKIKTQLEKKGIICSVGSACNTASDKASHVLYAMSADELIRKGALRISLGDSTTMEQANIFIKEFILTINSMM